MAGRCRGSPIKVIWQGGHNHHPRGAPGRCVGSASKNFRHRLHWRRPEVSSASPTGRAAAAVEARREGASAAMGAGLGVSADTGTSLVVWRVSRRLGSAGQHEWPRHHKEARLRRILNNPNTTIPTATTIPTTSIAGPFPQPSPNHLRRSGPAAPDSVHRSNITSNRVPELFYTCQLCLSGAS